MDNIEELTEIKEQSMELSPIKNLFEIISFCKQSKLVVFSITNFTLDKMCLQAFIQVSKTHNRLQYAIFEVLRYRGYV